MLFPDLSPDDPNSLRKSKSSKIDDPDLPAPADFDTLIGYLAPVTWATSSGVTTKSDFDKVDPGVVSADITWSWPDVSFLGLEVLPQFKISCQLFLEDYTSSD